jgi:hypothetical protein
VLQGLRTGKKPDDCVRPNLFEWRFTDVTVNYATIFCSIVLCCIYPSVVRLRVKF